jgi:hypothetical protein
MGLTIQDMLSGDIVKRQAPQQDSMAGLGTLLSFLSQGQVQMPQAAPLPESRGADTSMLMHMMGQSKSNKDELDADQLVKSLMGNVGTDRVPTPLMGAHDATPGEGYLGGQKTPEEVMSGLMSNKVTRPFGMAMLNDQFAPRAPVAPHYMEMGVPGKEGYRTNAVMGPNGPQAIGEPWKPSSGVNIDMGNGTQMRPATDAEKLDWGFSPKIPATKNTKTGELVQHPVSVTEDQAKSGMFYGGLNRAVEHMKNNLDFIATQPADSMKDFAADTVSGLGIPFVSPLANSNVSPDRQAFNQQRSQALTAIIHSMSGSGFSEKEQETKAEAMVPKWGDDKKTIASKIQEMGSVANDLKKRAGPGIADEVKSAPEVIPALSPDSGKEIEAEMRRRGLLK